MPSLGVGERDQRDHPPTPARRQKLLDCVSSVWNNSTLICSTVKYENKHFYSYWTTCYILYLFCFAFVYILTQIIQVKKTFSCQSVTNNWFFFFLINHFFKRIFTDALWKGPPFWLDKTPWQLVHLLLKMTDGKTQTQKEREPWWSNEDACHNEGNYFSHFLQQTLALLSAHRWKTNLRAFSIFITLCDLGRPLTNSDAWSAISPIFIFGPKLHFSVTINFDFVTFVYNSYFTSVYSCC